MLIPQGGFQDGYKFSLLGYPVEENSAAPSTNSTGEPAAVFGNLDSVIIGERLASSLALFRNPYRKATERLTQYLFFARVGMADALPLKRCRIITG